MNLEKSLSKNSSFLQRTSVCPINPVYTTGTCMSLLILFHPNLYDVSRVTRIYSLAQLDFQDEFWKNLKTENVQKTCFKKRTRDTKLLYMYISQYILIKCTITIMVNCPKSLYIFYCTGIRVGNNLRFVNLHNLHVDFSKSLYTACVFVDRHRQSQTRKDPTLQ